MKASEAIRVVNVLAAYYPARPMPTETAALWAMELEPFKAADGMAAARRLGASARFMPALSELTEQIRSERLRRSQAADQAALTDGAQGVSLAEAIEADPGLGERVRRLDPRWRLAITADVPPNEGGS